jgi:hypothetical protein
MKTLKKKRRRNRDFNRKPEAFSIYWYFKKKTTNILN